jgi:hypothetical protein
MKAFPFNFFKLYIVEKHINPKKMTKIGIFENMAQILSFKSP